MNKAGPILIILCFHYLFLAAQSKSIPAVKASGAIKIDGNLDETAWQDAPVATDFTQLFPEAGKPALAKTEVRILYDNDAVYIAASLLDDPSLIRRQLTARDAEQQADVDYFSVFFDTYRDQQNGFQFLVTAANVQTDARLGGSTVNGYGNYGDRLWDAVWQSKTAITEKGWVVEMRIPYISLRFGKKEVQTWGLQFLRFIRRNTETSFWNEVKPSVNGFVNQFGLYKDIQEIQPPLRLSFSPYVSTGMRNNPVQTSGSTYINKKEWLHSGGMDVKWGINESFTLDATLIPDFGQVVSDNVITNLTPFEQRFKENRPFFTEGTELFNKAGLFYSRRIGAEPMDYARIQRMAQTNAELELVRNPALTQLYNAVKFSGRTERKLGIGVFNAITAPMQADFTNNVTKRDTAIQTAPLTNYNIIVLDQALKGRSYLTFTNTNVQRAGNLRDANVAGLDFATFDKTNTYSFSGKARYSKIFGKTPYSLIAATPYSFSGPIDTFSSNGRLYVKPYDGFASDIQLGKVSGKIQYFASASVGSSLYDPTDLGYLEAPNRVNYSAGISYNQFTPTNRFLMYNYNLKVLYNWLYNPYKFSSVEIVADAMWVFKNMWDVHLNSGVYPVWQNDYFDLRTNGRFVKKPWYFYSFISGSSDSRKRLFFNYEVGMAEGALPNNPYFRTGAGLRYRFSKQLNVNLQLFRQHDKNQIGYAFLRESNGDPIIGFRSLKDFTTTLTANYTFTPRMSLNVRLRHYWSQVHYFGFYNVKADGYYTDHPFIPNQDSNDNLFNMDAFFTWDFLLGSRIIAGWKNWLGNDYIGGINASDQRHYVDNFKNSFSLPHGNEFTLRVIFFLDYNQIRCKN
ncbi:MAG: carbohydrate binding family 9 domain-containing protein [Flavisolibacter sp.]|nr:carbohydrate binding family 9 domain-containing protein [Flavisolibacter sp.]